jgi:hypothetical protein
LPRQLFSRGLVALNIREPETISNTKRSIVKYNLHLLVSFAEHQDIFEEDEDIIVVIEREKHFKRKLFF